MPRHPPAADEARSRTMSRIKGRDTSIELSLRRALWGAGIRYRKNFAGLPGAPDIAIPKYRLAIFCDGDFWHGRDWEAKKDKLHRNKEFWVAKIERNMDRDREVERSLRAMDWSVIRFWGTDIQKGLEDCLVEIENTIFSGRLDACATDWEFDEL